MLPGISQTSLCGKAGPRQYIVEIGTKNGSILLKTVDTAILLKRNRMKKLPWLLVLAGILLANRLLSQDIFKSEAQHRAVFRLILTDELQQIYDQIIDPADKDKWEQKYWKILDPTPGTEKNEYYLEFLDRVAFANKYYSNLVAPLFLDDRGKYYIKYGEPDDRVTSSGVGKPYRDNETWAYYDYNLFIDFVDQLGFGYREVYNLMDAITSGPANIKTKMAADLYLERRSLHQKYTSFMDVIDGTAGLNADGLFYQLTENLRNEKKLALNYAPPANYKFNYEKQRLDARMDCAIFRGEYGKSRVEIYYSIPLKQLVFQPGDAMPWESFVEKELTIFNRDFVKILQRKENLKIIADNEHETQKRIYINQHTELLDPGKYNIALKLDNKNGNRMAIIRAQLQVQDFNRDSLMMSTIQFSPRISAGASGLRNLKPNNILVVPYIGNTIRKTRPINVYFEIYHLTVDAAGKSRFKIAYEISAQSRSRGPLAAAVDFITHLGGTADSEVIGSSFEGSGTGEFQQIYLTIDFSRFKTGYSKLTIHVTDQVSHKSISGIKTFFIQ